MSTPVPVTIKQKTAWQPNAHKDPGCPTGLANFDLSDLDRYTKEGLGSTEMHASFRLYFVGRDDVHDILKHVISRVSVSLYLNMFGYDDEELNEIVMTVAHDRSITTAITLDKSQSGGVHEKRILASDAAKDPGAFNTSFAIGKSATHQISHTKGWVADGKIGGEGSTNWSTSGEGTFVISGQPGGTGYKAQNNTQSVFTTSADVAKFQAELAQEHLTVLAQGGRLAA